MSEPQGQRSMRLRRWDADKASHQANRQDIIIKKFMYESGMIRRNGRELLFTMGSRYFCSMAPLYIPDKNAGSKCHL